MFNLLAWAKIFLWCYRVVYGWGWSKGERLGASMIYYSFLLVMLCVFMFIPTPFLFAKYWHVLYSHQSQSRARLPKLRKMDTRLAAARSRRFSEFPAPGQQESPAPAARSTFTTPVNKGRGPRMSLAGTNSIAGGSTPRNIYTPLATPPSRSAVVPFDWEAVRNNAPPPYAPTPVRGTGARPRPSGGINGAASPKKRVVKKMSFIER